MRRAWSAQSQASTVEVERLFKQRFGYPATHVVQVPGCVQLMGSQADENEGLAMTIAVNRFLQMASAPRYDGRIALANALCDQQEIFWISQIEPNPAAPWANLPKAILLELRKHGVNFTGFNAAIYSTMPPGIQMGEAGALAVATALTVRKLHPYKLTETGCLSRAPKPDKHGRLPPLSRPEQLALAKLCRDASHRLDSPPVKLTQPLTSLASKAFHVTCLDYHNLTAEKIPFIGEAVAVLCPTGVATDEPTGRQELFGRVCREAAAKLRARVIRTVDPAWLSAHKMRLTELEYRHAYHIVGENQRIVFAQRALYEGDFIQFGQYLWQSHESARDFFQVSTAEQDLLVELARQHPGCIGARLCGDGLDGATVNLVGWRDYENFISVMAAQYERHTGRRIQPFACQIVDGAA